MTAHRDQVLEALRQLYEKLAIAIKSQDLKRVREINEIIHLTRETLKDLDKLLQTQSVES